MTIWVDADACPAAIKEILFRAAGRTGVRLVLVANRPLRVPDDSNVEFVLVEEGFDVADGEISRNAVPGDLVITDDIPLAAEVIDKGTTVIGFRGNDYAAGDIKARLAMRNFMETMRDAGEVTGGPKALGEKDRRTFAGRLDAFLAKHAKGTP
jgi:uncharacterized protein YaiI (UPF0178 family)